MTEESRDRLLAGRYRLIDELGSGGMGVVWRARDELLGREVAAKEVQAPAHLREHDVRILYARLNQEARAAAQINHPNVITVHDVVEEDGRPWIVMELVRGRSLAEILQHDGVLDPRAAARIGSMVLQGLRSAHAAGILHRDVKPANVLVEPGGRAVLTDFGIALIEGSGTLTRTGDLVGSPDFLAPERARGERPGAPSDLWSLGATLYAVIEGLSPFRRTTALGTLQAVVQDDLPPPRLAGPLVPLLEGLLRKDPRERMGSVEAQRLLDAVAAGHMTTRAGLTEVGPGGRYVPTAVGTPAPAPVSAPTATATSGPVPMPQPAPGPVSGHTPFPTPVHTPTPVHSGAVVFPLPAPDPAAPDRRRLVALLLGSVLALLLIAGGVAVMMAARGTGETGRSGGTTTGTPAPSKGAGAPDGSGTSDQPTTDQSTPSAGSTGYTCGTGGWLETCAPG
ncbi:serine/threonine-protein kinase [Streptomyces albireticuli]|uniref:non-specific serine/threonine protein kinase n=1 Tax=Streptomyces albireticuli TaxID=1940 RepID=A0A2A2D1P8_9ACTN|nr:serine/threonine-protein kinase [Streptomyces albireticuli]MCD9141359.1 protein kinase [Streptomyces albireticuli]MCD9160680.1 protein kinase [Streptomyces albireticuli]MCD9195764.1 protein kinase [Streptomyces albireticuli]PAU45260.1 serine/threonine protein kinase [Streptomyces albireticuli]